MDGYGRICLPALLALSLAACHEGGVDADVDAIVDDGIQALEMEQGPALELQVTATAICDEAHSHRLSIHWLADLPARIYLEEPASSSSFRTLGRIGQSTRLLAYPDGASVTVQAVMDAPDGSLRRWRRVELARCGDPPEPVPPALLFPGDSGGLGDFPLSDVGGNLQETAVLYIAGNTTGAQPLRFVTAVGSGAGARLSSWELDKNTLEPQLLAQGPARRGAQVRLAALWDREAAPPSDPIWLLALVRDGQLWLSTWRLEPDGSFEELHSLGYVHPRREVVRFGLTVRPGASEILTPVLDDLNKLRAVLWRIDANGKLVGLAESGELASGYIDKRTRLEAAVLGGTDLLGRQIDYVVSAHYREGISQPRGWPITAYLRVGPGNSIEQLGGSYYPRDELGSMMSAYGLREFSLLPLNPYAYLLAYLPAGTTATTAPGPLSVWDFQSAEDDGWLYPVLVAEAAFDQNPGPGRSLDPPPALTDGSAPEVAGGATQKVRARLADEYREDTEGIGAGSLFDLMPPGEPLAVGIASVTKLMTLLLTVEAIENGTVNLDDEIVVSEAAAATGGSSMQLQAGERQTLSNLLYGMIIESGNDASVAIAEHVAGDIDTFVWLMNQRALALGMNDTSYNHPAAGGYSIPQDQITLLRLGSKHELFRHFAGVRERYVCGEAPGGGPVCRNLSRSDSGYPGLAGFKNGNIGFHDPDKKAAGVPLCTSCLAVRARRAGRSMAVVLQQSGDRWGDADALFRYGARQLWTPDRRGQRSYSETGAEFTGLAADAVDDSVVLTSMVYQDTGRVRVCAWFIVADFGQIDPPACTSQENFGLAAGEPLPARRLTATPLFGGLDGRDYVMLSVDGDIVTAELFRLRDD
ncbi:MAG: D-alanyl-D-alanine carboxypeptidase [Gammaproteobacteria bacterium]|nr:MAG: D-alanyl-D-alanine carboxypeptidase [Gammaproteobacteria bacterium]